MVDVQPFLKRCSNTPKSSLKMTECRTPGSLTTKACFHETPKSSRGSSIFSPGEAFWDEAIQLADGLCGPMVSLSAQATELIGAAEGQYPTKNSYSFRGGNCNGMVKDVINKGDNMDIVAESHMDLDKENSPLPVKHFDFSLEEKSLDDKIAHRYGTDDLTGVADRVGEPSESGLIDHNALRNANTVNWHSSSWTGEEMYGKNEMPSVSAVIQSKVDLVGEDNVSMKSDSPHEVTKPIGNHESGESTPSSIMPRRDRLNLDSWLPSEICSVYKRKGILKLYPWQVLFKFE